MGSVSQRTESTMFKTFSSTDEKPPRFSDKQVTIAIVIFFFAVYALAGVVFGWFGIGP